MADEWKDVIVDGLTEYGTRYNDLEGASVGGTLVSLMADVMGPHIHPRDACQLAFPTMVVRPEVRTEGLVAIMADRVIIFWTKGLFRSKTDVEVIPRDSITEVTSGWGTNAATRKAKLVTISHNGVTSEFALPKDGSAFIAADIEAVLRPHSPAETDERNANPETPMSTNGEQASESESQLPTTTAPAAWHPDPWRVARLRWWDGTEWTGHTAE